MSNALERKVWIFDPKVDKPTIEDSHLGMVLALDHAGYWLCTPYWAVATELQSYRAWMQYPDLVAHKEAFNEAN